MPHGPLRLTAINLSTKISARTTLVDGWRTTGRPAAGTAGVIRDDDRAQGNPSPHRGLREDPGQQAVLYAHPRHAPREALRQSGRRERLSPLLRRREGDAGHRPHLLRL